MMSASLVLEAQVPERFNDDKEKKASEPERKKPEELTGQPGQKSSSEIWDRLVFGGDASISFGTATFIYLAPSVGYRVNNDLVVGAGYIYQYARINRVYNYATQSFQSFDDPGNTIHGPKAFFNYRFLESFYVGSQFEYLNHDFGFYDRNNNFRVDNLWTPVWFVEAGFSQPIGRKGFAVIGIRYNLLDDIQSPYATSWFPVIGVYF